MDSSEPPVFRYAALFPLVEALLAIQRRVEAEGGDEDEVGAGPGPTD